MAQADMTKKGRDHNGASQLEKGYGEIGDIRHDLQSLKENVRNLTRHLQKDGLDKAEDIKGAVSDGIDAIVSKGEDGMTALEHEIKENPRRSLIVAFIAGFALNLFFRKG